MSDTNRITATNVQKDVLEVVEALQKWHADGIAKLKELYDVPVEQDLVIDVDGQQFSLTRKQRAVFKAALMIASLIFEKFPITISKPGPAFLEGAEAWADCLNFEDCPYPEGTAEAADWKAGWTQEEEG